MHIRVAEGSSWGPGYLWRDVLTFPQPRARAGHKASPCRLLGMASAVATLLRYDTPVVVQTRDRCALLTARQTPSLRPAPRLHSVPGWRA